MKRTGLYKKMLNMAIGPILILGIAVTIFCYLRFIKTIYAQAEDDMINVAHSVMLAYDIAHEGDYYPVTKADGSYDFYKGEANITGDYSIVDDFKSVTGDEISLLYLDVRVNTTFTAADGTRLAGIYTNADTTEKVITNGEIAKYENVNMFNDKYLVVYVPLHNSSGDIMGMVEVAKSSSAMQKEVIRAIWPILVFSLGVMLIAMFFSYKSTKEITDVLRKLQVFMKKVSGGNLNTELDIEVLKRTDELGEISKSSVEMQRSIRSYVESDPLTKLGNRRFFLNQMDRVMSRAKENGTPFAVAIADIDFFKKVNDTYGHNAGDEVLKAVAQQLKMAMNGRGFAARWGGEEFVLCFNKVGMYDAADHLWHTLERIREMVVSTEGYDIKVTLTFGVVEGHQAKVETLVEEADEKLYFGKQHGRNRVVVDLEKEEETVEPENGHEVPEKGSAEHNKMIEPAQAGPDPNEPLDESDSEI